MRALRSSSLLIRLTLAWFVLTLGVAFASPMVHPQAMELLCSHSGSAKIIVIGNDGDAVQADHHTLDCPMCLATTPPVSRQQVAAPVPQPSALALSPVAAAHIAALVGAPLPPRGPPFFS